ncbi:MAG: patatin-like phospholipase family protein [Pseudomonadota bacterium]
MRGYCIFQGGGASGVAHIGVLRAIQELKIEIKGYAGTSAGAMIAMLAAVGYTDRELLDAKEKSSLLGLLPNRLNQPYKLLGKSKNEILSSQAEYSKWIDIENISILRTLLNLRELKRLSVALSFGILDLNLVYEAIQECIVRKLGGEGKTTFGELAEKGFPDLRIVSTNLSHQRFELFSASTRPDTMIADAVCASIAIPGLFKPWRISEDEGRKIEDHADGGLVSNLPVWAFNRAIEIDREAVLILSEIVNGKSEPTLMDEKFKWLSAVVRTAAFGADDIHKQSLQRNISVPLRPKLDLLDFEPTWSDLKDDIENAYNATQAKYLERTSLLGAVGGIRDEAKKLLLESGFGGGRLRCAIAIADGRAEDAKFPDDVLGLSYCVGYDDSPDYLLKMSYNRSLYGAVIKKGSALFVPGASMIAMRNYLTEDEDRNARSRIYNSARWRLIIPLRAQRNRERFFCNFAICIDGDKVLPSLDQSLEAVLRKIVWNGSEVMAAFVSCVMPEDLEILNERGDWRLIEHQLQHDASGSIVEDAHSTRYLESSRKKISSERKAEEDLKLLQEFAGKIGSEIMRRAFSID